MLEHTLVIWGGEMGRSSTVQAGSKNFSRVGRDHHIDGYTIWLAGGGVKAGTVWGSTVEFGMAVTENNVDMHDLHATILHQMGFDHKQLTYKYSGRDFRLTNVHGEVVTDILG